MGRERMWGGRCGARRGARWCARRSLRWVSALAVGACVAPSMVAAQAGPPMELTRLTGSVELDGTPDEDAWTALSATRADPAGVLTSD